MESVVMKKNFWNGKKVLITGHTGFKGSWMSLWLQKKGAHITGYALPPPTTPSFFETGNIEKDMISITGDVRDLQHLKTVVEKHRPEIIIHMAAQPIVRYSYSNPIETFSTNIMGTVNVLETVRQTDSVKVVLIITSDKCYDNKEWLWGYRENDPMGGHDPYSSSKGCAELITSAFRRSYFSKDNFKEHGVAVASARAGNVIGGGDWGHDRLVPDIMRAIMENQPVLIRNPHAHRPWQHVLEPLSGYMCLIKKLWENGEEFTGGWNFGPEDSDCKPVSWIMKNLDHLWDGSINWKLDSADNPHEATYLKLDCSKAKKLLGWFPKLKLATALEWVAEWYSIYFNSKNIREISEKQISRYEKI